MLLIDGVKYEEWTPQREVNEFHPIIREHVKDIFGPHCRCLEGTKLQSSIGGGVPDFFVLNFGNPSGWHIVEAELAEHQIFEHITNQISRFIAGINDPTMQKRLAESVYHELTYTKIARAEVEELVDLGEVYKFIADLISKPPVLTIIIERTTEKLKVAIDLLRYNPIKIVEFRTFRRVGAENAHIHLFDPIYKPNLQQPNFASTIEHRNNVIRQPTESQITLKDLMNAKMISSGQMIHKVYNGQKFEAKVLSDGDIELTHNGEKFSSINMAAKSIAGSVNAWIWWRTTRENGEECPLDELRKEYRATHPFNP